MTTNFQNELLELNREEDRIIREIGRLENFPDDSKDRLKILQHISIRQSELKMVNKEQVRVRAIIENNLENNYIDSAADTMETYKKSISAIPVQIEPTVEEMKDYIEMKAVHDSTPVTIADISDPIAITVAYENLIDPIDINPIEITPLPEIIKE